MRVYGPVPSRRFGLSLGVDVVPHKSCTFDCIYCQLGPTEETVERRACFYPLDEILRDVEIAIAKGPKPDVITLAGSGEPTLYSRLGELMDGLHALASVPVLLITNSSLLHDPEVAEASYKADILAPSLDAGDEETYRRINRPHSGVTYEKLFEGLKTVTQAHPGEVHLEVMIIDRVNDDEKSLQAIAERIKVLRYDRIDINTPVRPPMPGRGALPADEEVLERAARLFGPLSHPIGSFRKRGLRSEGEARRFVDCDKDIREMLLRRPCTVKDVADALALSGEEVILSLAHLERSGLVARDGDDEEGYYRIVSENPTLARKS